jgi:nucleotidyltransferase substrate binding protein (TIGR01987 family)
VSNERLKQRIEQFQRAVDRLRDACRQPENEFIRDSVIQRFEFSYELAWKMLKLKLEQEGIEAATPRAVIREAVAAHLLDDGNRWSEMLQKRNLTSHTYDDRLAREVYAFVCNTALPLFQALREESTAWR